MYLAGVFGVVCGVCGVVCGLYLVWCVWGGVCGVVWGCIGLCGIFDYIIDITYFGIDIYSNEIITNLYWIDVLKIKKLGRTRTGHNQCVDPLPATVICQMVCQTFTIYNHIHRGFPNTIIYSHHVGSC